MTLDVHTLDQVLLVGTGVLLLAILAVRLSVGLRAADPARLPADRASRWGSRASGCSFDNAEVAHALGFAALILILAEGGLTTPWPEIRPVMRLGVSLATIGVAVSVLVMAVLLPLRARAELGALGAARRGHLAHRRGRGVLGAAPGAAAAPADRRARGRVGPQRRPDGRAGHPGQRRRRATASWASPARSSGSSASASSAGSRSGSAAPGCCAARRCRARASTRWRCCPSPSSRTPAPPPCTAPASPRCTSPR